MPAFGLAFLWLSYQRPDAPPPPEEPPPPLKPPPEPPPLEPPPEEDEEEPFLEALSLPSFLYLARSFINDKPKNKQWYDGKRREHTAGND